MNTKHRLQPVESRSHPQRFVGNIAPPLGGVDFAAATESVRSALGLSPAVFEQITSATEPMRKLLASLVRLEQLSGGESATDVLTWIADEAESHDLQARVALTDADEDALRSVGSYVSEMPSLTKRGSFLATVRGVGVRDSALSSAEVAELLGRTPARIRQRAKDRSLYCVTTDAGLAFPAVQFSDSGELPGWSKVAPCLPDDAHPVEVEALLTAATSELLIHGKATSPRNWLLSAGDPERVATFVAGAFGPR